jgi:ABC-type sulfate transport system permease subunit
MVLGATAWQMFFRVTLPKIKWGLLYGVVLCTARAMGEFGAVSVVSGHIRWRGRARSLPRTHGSREQGDHSVRPLSGRTGTTTRTPGRLPPGRLRL